MKRSEIINLIIKHLSEHDIGSRVTYEESANILLDILINIGMSPPWYTPKEQPFTDLNDKFGQWSSHNEICDWEPE